jgi:hypothetical protein
MYSHTTTKIITATIVLFALVSCSHETDDTSDYTGDILLTTQIIHWEIGVDHGDDHGGHDSDPYVHTDMFVCHHNELKKVHHWNNMEFIYNANGRLIATVEGMDSVHYLYSNGRLSSILTSTGYYDGGKYIDTTRFFYEGEVLKYATSSHEGIIVEMTFDSDNNILTKFIHRFDTSSLKFDSLYYEWKDGNLVKITTKSGYPFENYVYQREFRYDDRPSYTVAINYPREYLFAQELTHFYGKYPLFYYDELLWRYNNRNNPIEFVERSNDATRIIEYHIEYNEAGYPKRIQSKNFTMVLAYNGEAPDDHAYNEDNNGHDH